MNTKEITFEEAKKIVETGGRVVVVYDEKGNNLNADKEKFFNSNKINEKARFFLNH